MVSLNFSDCVLPSFVKSRLERHLSNNDFPSMVFESGFKSGAIDEPYIAARLLAKAIDADVFWVDYGVSSSSKNGARGNKNINALDHLLNSRTVEGKRRVLIIHGSNIRKFPSSRTAELSEMIRSATAGRIIFIDPPTKITKGLPTLPEVYFGFDPYHSPSVEEDISHQYQRLLSKLPLTIGSGRADEPFSKYGANWWRLIRDHNIQVDLPEIYSLDLVTKKWRRPKPEYDSKPQYTFDYLVSPSPVEPTIHNKGGLASIDKDDS